LVERDFVESEIIAFHPTYKNTYWKAALEREREIFSINYIKKNRHTYYQTNETNKTKTAI